MTYPILSDRLEDMGLMQYQQFSIDSRRDYKEMAGMMIEATSGYLVCPDFAKRTEADFNISPTVLSMATGTWDQILGQYGVQRCRIITVYGGTLLWTQHADIADRLCRPPNMSPEEREAHKQRFPFEDILARASRWKFRPRA